MPSTNSSKPEQIVLYLRVSSEEQQGLETIQNTARVLGAILPPLTLSWPQVQGQTAQARGE